MQAAVQGVVVIYDIGGVTTSHTLMMTPAIMKKHVVVFQVGEQNSPQHFSAHIMVPCKFLPSQGQKHHNTRLLLGCLPHGQHGPD